MEEEYAQGCGGTEEGRVTSALPGWRGNSLEIFPKDVTHTMNLKDKGAYGR